MINKFYRSHLIQVVVKRFLSTSLSETPAQKVRATSARMDKKPLAIGSAARTNFDNIIATPEIHLLSEIFKTNGHEIRIAGGAVRDLLSGSVPHDIDFATTATPSEMISFLSPHEKDVRIITTKSGEKHGTITARIKDRVQYEVTTLRIDKKTDGRHAEVEFIQDWVLDAARRDLTINAMFLDMSGYLYDYFNGSEDLEKNLIRFVGDPVERIQEDFLRILRYFRFYVRYGSGHSHDQPTIEAIRSNLDGLLSVSGERIWTELKRILILPRCNVVMSLLFEDLNVGKVMGFHSKLQKTDLNEFDRAHKVLFTVEEMLPITLFTSIISNDEILGSVSRRLKFSNNEFDVSLFIITNRNISEKLTVRKLKKKLALSARPDQQSMRNYMIELMKYLNRFDDAVELSLWSIPEFPFSGHLLREKVKTPRDIGRVINSLKDLWAENDYHITNEQITQRIDEVLSC